MHISRARLADLRMPSAFLWAVGIEDTFITAPHVRTGRRLDEYELTEHYARWPEDIDLMARLRVPVVRYGIPWHRINPARGVWDFDSADGPLERLLGHGIQPIVDLVHYGLPAWITDAYLNPDFPSYMAEYAVRVAERYRGRIHAYTPLNEPRITAWYCGKLGWWPPYQRGWRGFVRVMLGVCRGIVTTTQALRDVDDEIACVHVDATDLYTAAASELEAEAARRQDIVFLALDLVTGRIGSAHVLYSWLLTHGASEADLAWFQDNALSLDVVGINLYPMFSSKLLLRTSSGLRVRMRYSDAGIVESLADMYWQRYQRPVMITETAAVGSVAKRMAWLQASVAATKRARSRGIPIVGYTWWPLFALVTWGYREGSKPAASYLRQMGLWDLVAGPNGLGRAPTRLVDEYQSYVAAGSDPVGPLAAPTPSRSPARVS